MDPPPLPPSSHPALPPPSAAAAVNANIQLINYPPPDAVDSSPRRCQPPDSILTNGAPNEANAAAMLPPVPGAKLRLMCSYGGHIIPRPHDKSLCYVGGETRIVVVDRNSTIASLSGRLSRTLPLNGRPFTLKYQLPNEDLDSLVSVATDEDLDNMIEEYDRITGASAAAAAAAVLTSSSSSPRIRLFLFFSKPVTAASMGALKSESWFFDALNSGPGAGSDTGLMLLPRNLSDTATMDGCVVATLVDTDHYNLNQHQDSPVVVENFNAATTTGPPSSGSSCSTSPSGMANLLPPIRVRTPVDSDFQGFGGEGAAALVVVDQDQFGYHQQLSSAQIQLDSISITSAASTAAPSPSAASIAPAGGSSEHLNRVSSEDDDDTRSDPGRAPAGVGFRKPPLPLPLPHQQVQHQHQQQHKLAAFNTVYNPPPSPDSVTSDSSIASAASVAKSYHQDKSAHPDEVLINQQQQNEHIGNTNPNSNMNNQMTNATASHQIPIQQQQLQDPAAATGAAYTYLDQQQQQQLHFVKAGPGGQLIHSYYPPQVYSPHQHQQYPTVYVMPMPMQPQQQQPGATAAVPASPAASQSHHQPPLYAAKFSVAPASGKPAEMGTGVMYTSGYPSMVPGNHLQLHHFQQQYQLQQQQQQQQQYVGYSQMQQPSRHESMAVGAAATSGGNSNNYGYEYGAPPATPTPNEQQQMFYAQQGQGMGSNVMASHHHHHHQYQTIGQSAAASAALLPADGSNQNPAVQQQQQIEGSSQRLQ